MKIVDVNEFYSEHGGGVRTYVDAKLRAGAAHGCEVVVVAPGAVDREERRGAGRIRWIKSPPLPIDVRYRLFKRESALHDVIDRERPDVLEGSSPWLGGLFCARYRGSALKSFVFHSDPIAVYPQTLLGDCLGNARVDALCGGFYRYLRALSAGYDLTVTSGVWLAERLRQFGIHAPLAVPFGIQKNVFSPDLRSPELRSKLIADCGMPADASLLIVASRHHPEKRLGVLLGAVALVQQSRPVALALYGDGPLRSLVARRARRLRGVRLMGHLANRTSFARVLASADALVHGSTAETFGLVVAEALSAGLPVVVPDRGGAAELASPDFAEIYRAGDASACAAAIERLLQRERAALRAAAVRASARRPSLDDHFAQLFAIYANRAAVIGDHLAVTKTSLPIDG